MDVPICSVEGRKSQPPRRAENGCKDLGGILGLERPRAQTGTPSLHCMGLARFLSLFPNLNQNSDLDLPAS